MDNSSGEKKRRTTRLQEAMFFKRWNEDKMAKQGKSNREKQREILYFKVDDDSSEEEIESERKN